MKPIQIKCAKGSIYKPNSSLDWGQVFSNQLSINNILGVYDIHLTPFYDLGECKSTMQSLVDELNKDNILY